MFVTQDIFYVDNISRRHKIGSRLTWGFVKFAALVIISVFCKLWRYNLIAKWTKEHQFHLPSKWLMARIRMLLRVSALPWLTFGTAVHSKPNYVNSCTVLVLPWGVSILSFQVRIDCFLYGRNRKRGESSFHYQSKFILLSFDWSSCSRWKLECIRYLLRIRFLTHGCPYRLTRHWCEIKGFAANFSRDHA